MNVRIRGLNKRYGNVLALKNINLDISLNSFTTLLGPSGCGKTTLLRCIAGLETPDSGEIHFDETCVFSSENNINLIPQKRNLGMVFQDFALWPHMTVEQNIGYTLEAKGIKQNKNGKVHDAMKMVRLEGMGQRKPSQLSGGQQQRVAFARAVVSHPSLVLFDEPLSALDALLREQMRQELTLSVKEMGLTAVYVTHDQMEAMSMSDTIIVMNDGCVIQQGLPEDIYENPADRFVMEFVGKMNWFPDKSTCIRPEQIRLSPGEEDMIEIRVSVRNVSFLGDRYELFVTPQGWYDYTWTLYHNKKIGTDQELMLYLPPQKILKAKKSVNESANKIPVCK